MKPKDGRRKGRRMDGIQENRNCHEYCPFRKQCRYDKGEIGRDPEYCGTYFTIEKVTNEQYEDEDEEGDW